ncbi:MAG: filamentous hemagglutinin N-terminal domain-containing protein, partial [Tsuneonella sp.]
MKNVRCRAMLALRSSCATVALTALFAAASVQAQDLPAGGSPADPSTVSIATGPNQVTVTQTSQRGVINWNSFNVAQGNSIVFVQPDAGAATLNRVTGGTSSTIAGQIRANGSVYLINPNGIAITSTGSVRTGGGFVASTLGITDSDFNRGTDRFT